MRTTVDLPDDLHQIAKAIARDQNMSLSETIAVLLRRAIGASASAETEISERTGLEVIRLGQVITSEDVRSLDDE
jgi:predicted transcriptional regulator